MQIASIVHRGPKTTLCFVMALISCCSAVAADWPMIRGDAQHTGFVAAELKPPFRLSWAREFKDERLGTAMEPIVAGGRVFVTTHAGNLYCLRAEDGEGVWRFQAQGPFLHSPAVVGDRVLAACSDGNIYALDPNTGKLEWRHWAGYGGFSAAPVLDSGLVFVGTRGGDFLALSLKDGQVRWQQALGAPIRQTAAVADGHVVVTGEDLRVRCFQVLDGKCVWTSEPLVGQTARDYYPMVVMQPGRTNVIIRTNPLLNMGQRIGRDRTVLCRNSGVDDSSWQKLDAWIKSGASHGNPDQWAAEQKAVGQCLATNREAQSFFVLDAATGKEAAPAPVLWAAGCQGVGAPPALMPDGRLLVFYRSAYGNWNQGVAPLVGLGLLDLQQNRITPLFHHQGAQPPWNCFWGTADESQSFLVAGKTGLIVHQGTLSGFDFSTNDLFPIWGERDTYGGFRNPPWARNEWHGPARSGVAVAQGRLFWQTGSRILCLAHGQSNRGPGAPQPMAVSLDLPATTAPSIPSLGAEELRHRLVATAEEIMARTWAPLFTDPGLAGRVFAFDQSGELFEVLAWAWPHLPVELQKKTKDLLRTEWERRPPLTRQAWLPLAQGERREWFHVPADYCARLGSDRQPHPFGNLYAVRLCAQRSGDEELLRDNWPAIKAAFEDFTTPAGD
jgi:hypothetical protein